MVVLTVVTGAAVKLVTFPFKTNIVPVGYVMAAVLFPNKLLVATKPLETTKR